MRSRPGCSIGARDRRPPSGQQLTDFGPKTDSQYHTSVEGLNLVEDNTSRDNLSRETHYGGLEALVARLGWYRSRENTKGSRVVQYPISAQATTIMLGKITLSRC